MIRFLQMQNFRGVQRGTLDELTPLVVLVGPNSSGKSTVLDALLIGGARDPKDAVARAATRRHAVNPGPASKPGQTSLFGPSSIVAEDYPSLLYRSSSFAEVAAKAIRGGRRVVIKLGSNGPVVRWKTSATKTVEGWDTAPEEFLKQPQDAARDPTLPGVAAVELVDSRNLSGARTLEELYTLTSQRGLRKEVKSFITQMLPDVDDLEILAPANVPTLHLNFSDHALPIGLAGDGVQLLLRLVLVLTATPETTILLEEPETHMHPGAIRLVAQAVHAAVARGVQVVLTTHSLELIDALSLGRPTGHLEQLSVFRVALDRGNLKSTRLSGQEVALARSAIEDDLR